jgi:hypothetical protein
VVANEFSNTVQGVNKTQLPYVIAFPHTVNAVNIRHVLATHGHVQVMRHIKGKRENKGF